MVVAVPVPEVLTIVPVVVAVVDTGRAVDVPEVIVWEVVAVGIVSEIVAVVDSGLVVVVVGIAVVDDRVVTTVTDPVVVSGVVEATVDVAVVGGAVVAAQENTTLVTVWTMPALDMQETVEGPDGGVHFLKVLDFMLSPAMVYGDMVSVLTLAPLTTNVTGPAPEATPTHTSVKPVGNAEAQKLVSEKSSGPPIGGLVPADCTCRPVCADTQKRSVARNSSDARVDADSAMVELA
jgi:hypothetical protein